MKRGQSKSKSRRVGVRPFAIDDLVGSVDGLPVDLSANTKRYLRALLRNRRKRGLSLI